MKTLSNHLRKTALSGLCIAAAMLSSCSKEQDIVPAKAELSEQSVTTDDSREDRIRLTGDRNNGKTAELATVLEHRNGGVTLDPTSGLGVQFTDAADVRSDAGKLITKPTVIVCRLCDLEGAAGESAEGTDFAPIR